MFFRYDLRINDNDAFFEASQNQNCLPVFILDEGYLNLKTTSEFHLSFLNDSLNDLKSNLKKINAKLNFYKGDTTEILNFLTDKYKVTRHRVEHRVRDKRQPYGEPPAAKQRSFAVRASDR